MNWGTELWDQHDNLSTYTQKGIEFCERYSKFIKDRCEIENDYAAKLKRLVKNHVPKKKGEEESEFTCVKGFVTMVKEIHDVAGQHEQIAEDLLTSIQKELHTLIHEMKKERKELFQEANKLNNSLQSQYASLERVKKKYEKSFSEMEKAQDAYHKADKDIHLSRAEVEKAKSIMQQKEQHCENCKKEYASELQKTNQCQSQHYSTQYPKVFQDLQNMEQKRIEQIKGFISHSAETERSVIPIVNTCIDGIVRAANTVNPTEDIKLVIEKYKSGFVPPGDIPFEDLSNGNVDDMPSSQTNQQTPKATRSDTVKGTQSSKNKKRGGLFGIFGGSKNDETREDYSHLPPNQQKKKLQQKIEAVRQNLAKETAERDGMQKMRSVYDENNKLGDPAILDKQLAENGQKLDKLKEELQKYEGYLQQAERRSNTLDPHDTSGLQRKMSDLSINSSNTSSNPGTPNTSRSSKLSSSTYQNIPNSIQKTSTTDAVPDQTRPISTVGNANRPSVVPYTDGNESFDDMDDEFSVIGTCTALYAFEAPNEGSIPMKDGETMQVVSRTKVTAGPECGETTVTKALYPHPTLKSNSTSNSRRGDAESSSIRRSIIAR